MTDDVNKEAVDNLRPGVGPPGMQLVVSERDRLPWLHRNLSILLSRGSRHCGLKEEREAVECHDY